MSTSPVPGSRIWLVDLLAPELLTAEGAERTRLASATIRGLAIRRCLCPTVDLDAEWSVFKRYLPAI